MPSHAVAIGAIGHRYRRIADRVAPLWERVGMRAHLLPGECVKVPTMWKRWSEDVRGKLIRYMTPLADWTWISDADLIPYSQPAYSDLGSMIDMQNASQRIIATSFSNAFLEKDYHYFPACHSMWSYSAMQYLASVLTSENVYHYAKKCELENSASFSDAKLISKILADMDNLCIVQVRRNVGQEGYPLTRLDRGFDYRPIPYIVDAHISPDIDDFQLSKIIDNCEKGKNACEKWC